MRPSDLSRRDLLRTGGALAAAGLLGAGLTGGTAGAARPSDTNRELRALETRYAVRLGVYARNLHTGATVTHRAGERFPMLSVFKTLAAGCVLRDHDRAGEFLRRVIHYRRADLVANSPITQQHVDTGMTVGALCAAAIDYSDNTAGNLLLHAIGGPPAITRFARSIGDPYTRLDRYETVLNTAYPGDPRDTTTPTAIAGCFARLVAGRALTPADRCRLTGWLLANTTSAKRFRAGLPAGWTLADKTGTGDYGSANDVGVAWTSRRTPVVMAVLTRTDRAGAPNQDQPLADAARLLAARLAPEE